MKNIFLWGLSGSGKDTASNYMVERYGYLKIRLSNTIKQIICEKYDLTFDELEERKRVEPKFRNLHHEIGAYLDETNGTNNRLKQLIDGTSLDYQFVKNPNDRLKVFCDIRRLHDVVKCLEAGYLGIFLTKQPTEYRNMTNNNGTETNLLEINNLLDLLDSFGASNIMIIDNSNGQLSEKENENLKIISQFVFMVKTDGSVEALHKAIDGIFNYVLTV